MNGVSFFAGIGGLDLGFERAGINVVCQIERDPFCQKILAKHWPHVTRYGDIKHVGKNRRHQLPKADIFFGGFPCQPHSTAGKRKGASDDRDLWPEYFRVIGEYRPNWVLGENVPGIRTTILDQVLSDLESLDYTTVPLAIPAAGFNAPHIRERIFIIAHTKSSTWNLPIPTGKQEEELYIGGFSSNGNVANPASARLERKARSILQNKISDNVRNPDRQGLAVGKSQRENDEQELPTFIRANWWNSEPGVCGVANGVSNRVDRIRSLGNAVVPQEAEFIGRLIVKTNQFTN